MRTILHVDLNNFYAAVECLYRPEIRLFPVAVCGDPANRHGIVLAKNMLAKKLGVTTGEAIWQAKTKAPNLVLVPPDFNKYLRFSRLAKTIYYDYTDQIEPFGIDECWLDVTGSSISRGNGRHIADEIRQRVKAELGVTVSVGVSFNKIFAKLGSDLRKPDATTLITPSDFRTIVWPLPISDLLYVGRATQRKLREISITTIGDLATRSPQSLVHRLGKWGEILWSFANGLDSEPVHTYGWETAIKSVGNGTTAPRDLLSDEDVKLIFSVLADSVAQRLREYGLKAGGIQISWRDNQLAYGTRQAQLRLPTFLTEDLLTAAEVLFRDSYTWLRPIRALSLRGINLETADTHLQLDLFDAKVNRLPRREALAKTVDSLRSRFGHNAILAASCLLDKKLTGFSPKEEHVIHPFNFFK